MIDVSGGKPWVEVQRRKEGPWEKLGELTSYPETTNTNPKGLRQGQPFVLSLTALVTAVAVRVVGKPASGDNPNQAFSSCGELMVE